MPAPPPVAISTEFMSDKVIGIVVMVLGGLSALGGIFAIALGSIMGQAERSMFRGRNPVDAQSFPNMHIGSTLGIFGLLSIAIAVVQIAVGVGVFKSSRNGFIFALVIAVLSALGGVIGFIVGVAIGLYADPSALGGMSGLYRCRSI